jgi:hypothetical protein
MKKSLSITSVLLLIGQFCLAQLNATLNMSFSPSPKILEWASNPQTVTLMVSNSSSNTIDYKIKATVLKDGNLVAQTKLNRLSTLSIDGAGFESYFVDDIIPSSALDIVDQSISRTVLQTGKLPGGSYVFCVELVDPVTFTLLSTKQCRPFRITDYQPSRLTLPLNKSVVVSNNVIQFSWTPIQPSAVVTYYFRMVEIKDGQNAFSAFTENQSFVETELTGQTMLIYTSDFPVLEEGKSYIWSVQAEDMNGDIVGEDNGFKGWAEPFLFAVKKDDFSDEEKEKEKKKEPMTIVSIANDIEMCNCDLGKIKVRKYRMNQDIWILGGLGNKMSMFQTCMIGRYSAKDRKKLGLDNIFYRVVIDWGNGKIEDLRNGKFHKYDNSETTEKLEFEPNIVCVTFTFRWGRKGNYSYCEQNVCDTLNPVKEKPCSENDIDFSYTKDNLQIKLKDSSVISTDWQSKSSYTWDMGDGTVYRDEDTLMHIYNDEGSYNICLKYMFENNGNVDTCKICKPINISIDCDADVNFTKSKSGYDYTFSSRIELTNGATIDSMNWFINDDHHSRDTAFTVNFNNTRKRDVCLLTYINNADGTKCTLQKCKEVSLEGCAFEECTPNCDAVSSKTYAAEDVIHLCGGLDMEIIGTPSGTASSLTGKGKVNVPWLFTDVAVEFSGIKVSDQEYLCDGEIWAEQHETAPTYPQQWGINAVGGFVIGEPFLKDIETWIYNTSKQLIDEDLNQQISSQMNPVKVPLGINNAEGYTLAMSAFQFTPDRNKFSAMAIVPVDFYDDHTLGFEATEITFTSDGPISPLSPGGSGGLEIIAPKTIYYTTQNSSDNADWFAITFHKKGNGHIGTGFNFTNPCGTAFNWCFRVDADVEMPRQWFTPIPDLGNKVRSNIQSEVCNWTDWLVSIDLPRCELTGSDGFELEVTDFTLDFSSVRNQPGMAFPANWQGDRTESFKGFWMKQAKLIFPKEFTTFADTNRRLETQLNNWIIHKNNGFTGELLAINIINFPDGNIADLGASIDTIKLNMVNSSFTQAYMRGQVLLPLTDDSPSNALNYKALFGRGVNGFQGFQFNMEPDGTIKSKFFAGADLEIYQTSYLDLLISNGSTSFDIILNGMIDLPDQINNPVNNQDIPIDFNTTFEGLGMKYSKNGSNKTFTFEQGEWGFASPPKKLYNFPISIENFKPIVKLPQGIEMCTGGMSFDAIINLANKKIGGRTTIDIIGAINKPDGERVQPVFKEVNLSSVSVYADLAAIKMNGTIDFISNDPIYGDGVRGNIDARFNSINTSVAAAAFFGTSSFNSAGKYRYWKVEAQATLPPPGIPFLPGVAFRGFGAGAYHHMKAEFTNSPLSASGSSSSPLFSGATFTPDPSISFGFKAKAIVATSPKEESFNGDIGIFGEFASTGGMTFLGFDGNFWIGAGFSKREDAITNGSVLAIYDFPSKIFDLGAQVRINKSPITTPETPLTLALHIDGRENKWYFKLGEPNNLNTVKIAGINVQQYLMFGNDIYSPPQFMSKTIQGYFSATDGAYPSIGGVAGQTVNDNTESGKGFAFGIAANFGSQPKTISLISRAGIQYSFGGGFEVNGSLMQYDPSYSCLNISPVGMNGWRMKGNVCAYAGISAGVSIAAKKNAIICSKGCYYSILDAGFGAWVSAEFPNPNYLAGGANIHYDILNGWISGSKYASFEIGNRCYGTVMTGGTNFVQEDSPEAQRRKLIIRVLPENNAVVDTSFTMTGVYGFTPNETFEAAEVQSDGSVINRTFQAKYQAKLYERDSEGQYTEVNLGENVNSIGEHIFHHQSITGAITASASSTVLGTFIPMQNNSEPVSGDNSSTTGIAYAAVGLNSQGTMQMTATTNGQASGSSSSSSSSAFGYSFTSSTLSIIAGINTTIVDNPDDYGDLAESETAQLSILKRATAYKFELEATLWELVNGTWTISQNNDNEEVVEIKTVHFGTTGYDPYIAVRGAAPGVNTRTIRTR